MKHSIPSILQDIAYHHRELVKQNQKKTSIQDMNIYDLPPTRPFERALMSHTNYPCIIAEIKKASPSKGILCKNFDIEFLAKTYEINGACALSVLTDVKYFQGSHKNIRIAKSKSSLPVLRKDFIVDLYQIYESRYIGADAILLIAAMLDDAEMLDFSQMAYELDMAVLVESHTEQEVERALKLQTKLIGINNRNLNDFTVNINTCINLAKQIPHDRIIIAESGINNKTDIELLKISNINHFLIGEALVTAQDPGKKLQEFQ